jgi:8-oxo-dGTP diphosphatase
MTLSSASSLSLIRIAAALLIGPDGRTLLVRKRGTEAFMQAGGKIEAHEQPVHALARELEEELGLVIDPATDGSVTLAPLTRDLILPFYRALLTETA